MEIGNLFLKKKACSETILTGLAALESPNDSMLNRESASDTEGGAGMVTFTSGVSGGRILRGRPGPRRGMLGGVPVCGASRNLVRLARLLITHLG